MFLSATATAVIAMVASCVLLYPSGSMAQFGFEEDVEEYKGRLVGTFNSYHHQVNGEVYAVDDFTMLIRNFVYDGNGKDTFFWAGGSNRPGTQGFIVPNESGRTNVLKRSTRGYFVSRNFNINTDCAGDLTWKWEITQAGKVRARWHTAFFSPPGTWVIKV